MRTTCLRFVAVAAVACAALLAAAPADAHVCGVCLEFVTTHDADRSGPGPSHTRMHSEIAPNVPYALDVDGALPPAPLGLLPVLPGYEVRVNVEGLDAVKPRISIQKLAGTVPSMPLRIEIVVAGAAGRFTTLGYDSLTSSAPQSFVADVDRSDRDGIAATSQVRLGLAIAAPASRLTLVNEEFTGNPAGTRTDRQIRRVEFEGDGVATRVPSAASLDLTTTSTRQHAVITRDAATKLNFEVAEPGDGPRTTGTIDRLPSRVELTLADVDVNGDGESDKQVDYVTSAVVGRAHLATQTSEQTTEMDVEDLPAEAHLTYVSAPGPEDILMGAPDQTKVVYRSSGRAKALEITTDDGKRRVVADVDNLPANIDELSATTFEDGGKVVFDSDGRTDRVEVDVTEGAAHTEAIVEDVPEDVAIDYEADDTGGRAHYVASGVAERADVLLLDERGQRRTIGVDGIPAEVLVTYEKHGDAGLAFDYAADGEVPRVQIDGTGIEGLPEPADEFHLLLERVPTGVQLRMDETADTMVEVNEVDPPDLCQRIPHPEENRLCPDHPDYVPPTETITRTTKDTDFAISTPGGRLGLGEIQITNGPDDRLPATAENGRPLDGVMLTDVEDRFVAFARVSEFDAVAINRHSFTSARRGPGFPRDHAETSMHAELDTAADGHALALDLDKLEGGEVKSTDAQLALLPSHVELDTSTNSTFGEDRTSWSASSPVDGFTTTGGDRRPGFSLVERSASGGNPAVVTGETSLDPMPAQFSVCKIARLNTCSEGRFDEHLTRLRDGITPYRTYTCLAACGDPNFPIEVDHAGAGSFLIKAATPTHLIHRSGDFTAKNGPYTTVDLQNLTVFGLQGDKEVVDCVADQFKCKRGNVGMDTGGQEITGGIEQKGEDSFTRLGFPEGFHADRLVWAFNQTSPASGELATIGTLHCPPGTEVQLGGETINERFCDGDLLEGGFFDQF